MGKDTSYPVGYRKPPRDRQFKPGRSGNPKGRPKLEPTYDGLIDDELRRRHPVVINGERTLITTASAVVKRLVERAMSGKDPKALHKVLEYVEGHQDRLAARSRARSSPPTDASQFRSMSTEELTRLYLEKIDDTHRT